jgi:hypothetical protein
MLLPFSTSMWSISRCIWNLFLTGLRKKGRKEGRKRFDLPLLEMQRRRRSQQDKILQLPSLKNPSAR